MLNKLLKKIFGAFGYKLVDKDLIKSQRIISSKSHLTVELLIENLIKKGKVKSLIQIGANDGLRFDILNRYIKENNLQHPDNRKVIDPNDDLKKLLGVKDSDEVTYFNLQRYMNQHFLKE